MTKKGTELSDEAIEQQRAARKSSAAYYNPGVVDASEMAEMQAAQSEIFQGVLMAPFFLLILVGACLKGGLNAVSTMLTAAVSFGFNAANASSPSQNNENVVIPTAPISNAPSAKQTAGHAAQRVDQSNAKQTQTSRNEPDPNPDPTAHQRYK